MKNGNVVITGATGHVGANLSRALLALGRPLTLIVRHDQKAVAGLDAQKVRADVLDPASLREAFADAEVVYHLAARIAWSTDDEQQVQRVNVIGTRNVVDACLQCGVRRLIHFSSIHALSQHPLSTPIAETNALAVGPRFLPYDRTKAAGEQEVLAGIARGLDAVIVNPTAVLGPHDYKPSAMGEVLLGLAQRRFFALVQGGYDWVDVRDVVQGALAAEAKGRCGERYLLSGTWHTLADLAALVEEVSGTKAPRWIAPMWLARLGAPFMAAYSRVLGQRPLYTSESLQILRANKRISHAKADRELGYHPRPLKETITDTMAWFRQVG